jgi:UDP-glucose 4-epimerase
VNELYKIIKEILDSPVEPRYGPARPGDIKHSYLDNTRARQVLEWKPRFGLREGLEETIDFYQQVFKKNLGKLHHSGRNF